MSDPFDAGYGRRHSRSRGTFGQTGRSQPSLRGVLRRPGVLAGERGCGAGPRVPGGTGEAGAQSLSGAVARGSALPRRSRTLLLPRERDGELRTLLSPVADIQRAAVARARCRSRAAEFVRENRPGDPCKPGGSARGRRCRRRRIVRRFPHRPSAGRGRLRRLGRAPGRRPRAPAPPGDEARSFEERSPVEKKQGRG